MVVHRHQLTKHYYHCNSIELAIGPKGSFNSVMTPADYVLGDTCVVRIYCTSEPLSNFRIAFAKISGYHIMAIVCFR